MNDRCNQWEPWVGGTFAPSESFQEHAAGCPSCSEQWEGHLALSELDALPLPPLSANLSARVREAVADRAAGGVLSAGQRRIMRVYWLLSTFAAGLILSQLGSSPPTAGAWPPVWLMLSLSITTLGLAGLPALLLLRKRLSWGLMDLLVWTFR